jgi:hypothetical protein
MAVDYDIIAPGGNCLSMVIPLHDRTVRVQFYYGRKSICKESEGRWHPEMPRA